MARRCKTYGALILFFYFLLFHQSTAKLKYYERILQLKIRPRFDRNNTTSFILMFRAFNQTFKMFLHRKTFPTTSTLDLGNTFSTTNEEIILYEGILVNKAQSYVSGVFYSVGFFYGMIKDHNQYYQIDSPKVFNITTKSRMIIFRQSDVDIVMSDREFCQTIPVSNGFYHHIQKTILNKTETVNLTKRQSDPIKYDYVVFVIAPDFFEHIVSSYLSSHIRESIQIMMSYVENMIWMNNNIYSSQTKIGLNLRLVLRKLHVITKAECKATNSPISFRSICTDNKENQLDIYNSIEKAFRQLYSHFDMMVAISFRQQENIPLGLARITSFCYSIWPPFVFLNAYQNFRGMDYLSLGYVLVHEIGHCLGSEHDDDDRRKECSNNYIMSARFSSLGEMKTRFSPCSGKNISRYLKETKHPNCMITKSTPPLVKCPGGGDCIDHGQCKIVSCGSKNCKTINVPDFSKCENGKKICITGKCVESPCSSKTFECSDGCFLQCGKSAGGKCEGTKIALPEGTMCNQGKGYCDYKGTCSSFKGSFVYLSSTLTSPCIIFRLVYGIKSNYALIAVILFSSLNFFGLAIFLIFGNETSFSTIQLIRSELIIMDFSELRRLFKMATVRRNVWSLNKFHINTLHKDYCYNSVRKYLKRYPFLFRDRLISICKYEPKFPAFLSERYSGTQMLSNYQMYSSAQIMRDDPNENELDQFFISD